MGAKLLKSLDDLSYFLECATLDCTDELKSELEARCGRIKNAEPGFCSPAVTTSLPEVGAGASLASERRQAVRF
jgi:hypothetical protein